MVIYFNYTFYSVCELTWSATWGRADVCPQTAHTLLLSHDHRTPVLELCLVSETSPQSTVPLPNWCLTAPGSLGSPEAAVNIHQTPHTHKCTRLLLTCYLTIIPFCFAVPWWTAGSVDSQSPCPDEMLAPCCPALFSQARPLQPQRIQ